MSTDFVTSQITPACFQSRVVLFHCPCCVVFVWLFIQLNGLYSDGDGSHLSILKPRSVKGALSNDDISLSVCRLTYIHQRVVVMISC